MKLTNEQRGVLYKSLHFLFNENDAAYVISGVAGSGKSTIVQTLCDYLPSTLDIWIVAFTGRAISPYLALDMPSNIKRSTLHGFLYHCEVDEDDNPHFYKKSIGDIRINTDILIVEEASMVNSDMFNQIEEIGVPMIFIGDKDQLPPISSDDFNIMEAYDYHLIESKRNGNYLGQFINNYRYNKRFSKAGENVKFLKKNDLTLHHFKENNYDAVLVATNKQKNKFNNLIRIAKGYTSEFPEAGETIINLRNTVLDNHSLKSDQKDVYVANGELLKVIRVLYEASDTMMYEVVTELGKKVNLLIHKMIWDNEDAVPKKYINRIDYGYAMSVWKAQGSEFNSVLYVHSDVSWFVDQHKFTYTAISRAKQNLAIAT